MLIDTHCHLDFSSFDEDRDEVIERAVGAGVAAIVDPSVDLEGVERVLALAERRPEVYAAVGVHPNDCRECGEDTWARLREIARRPEAVAIGEIGLDYYRDRTPRDIQRRALEAQLAIAAETGLPAILHNRESEEDLLAILRAWVEGGGTPEPPGVWHSFNLSMEWAEKIHDLGFFLGLGGVVTFKNARSVHEMVKAIPLEWVVLETDAPFLAPHPHRGRRNEPAYVALTAEAIARLKGVSVEKVASVTTANAEKLFGIRHPGETSPRQRAESRR